MTDWLTIHDNLQLPCVQPPISAFDHIWRAQLCAPNTVFGHIWHFKSVHERAKYCQVRCPWKDLANSVQTCWPCVNRTSQLRRLEFYWMGWWAFEEKVAWMTLRLEICQKIYTTGFSDQKFYTLKVRTLRLFSLKKKQRKCINLVVFLLELNWV